MSSQLASSLQEQQPERRNSGGLERWEHRDFEGIPYYDEDLQVPQGPPHQRAVFELGTVLEAIAEELGLTFTSDHPIWFFDPETGRQRRSYGDIVIARETETKSMTAEDILVLIEVVSTNDRRKEIKDTVFQRGLNESNGVPEFGLVFPDASDSRSLIWYRLNPETGRYDELSLSPGSEVEARGVEGLRLRVKPSGDWKDGRKIEVLFRNELRLPVQGERERAEQERERAEQERERAEQERERADQQRERADKLAAKLRAMGIDPDE
jgi:Uma2 family endonuclease